MPNSDDLQSEWDAIEILKERRNHYLIKWAGVDPDTNKPWKPSWQPKGNANELLVLDWLNKKKKTKRRNTTANARSTSTSIDLHSLKNPMRRSLRNLTSTTPSIKASPSPHPQTNRDRFILSSIPIKRKKTIPSTSSCSSPSPLIQSPSSPTQAQLREDSISKSRSKTKDTKIESLEQTQLEHLRRKRTKFDHDPKQAQVIARSSPTSSRSSPIESLPSPSQILSQKPPRSQSNPHLSSSQQLKLVVVPETQSSDDHLNPMNISPSALNLVEKNPIPIDSQISNRPRFTSAKSSRNIPSSPHNSETRSSSLKSLSNPNHDQDEQLPVQPILNCQKNEQDTSLAESSDDVSVHQSNPGDVELSELRLPTKPILDHNPNLEERSLSSEPTQKTPIRSLDVPLSESDYKKNAKTTELASRPNEPSKSMTVPQQAYEPDVKTAEIIANLNYHDDPDHKSKLFEFLDLCHIDAHDREMIKKFILNPRTYLADPENEIEPLRPLYELGNHMAFELRRDELGSICLWIDLTDPKNPGYSLRWDETRVRDQLSSMIFCYNSQPRDSASQLPIVDKSTPIVNLGLSQTSMAQNFSRSLISEHEPRLDLVQEDAPVGRGESVSPLQQDAVAQGKNKSGSPSPKNEISRAQAQSQVSPPSDDGPSLILEASQPDSDFIRRVLLRNEELVKALDSLKALFGGALDVNVDAEERERDLIESYESKLQKENKKVVELEMKNSQQAIELTGQRASIIKLEDELNQLKIQAESHKTQLKEQKELTSKLSEQNFEKSIELTGQRASLMKLEDELNSTKDNVKSLKIMLKESKHPAKEIYDAFINRHKLESSRLTSDLSLSMSTIARLQMMIEKDNELMKSFSSQNSRILDENQKLKATISNQTVELQILKSRFRDLWEGDCTHRTRIKLLEGFLEHAQKEISQVSTGNEDSINDHEQERLSETDFQQVEEANIGENPIQEVVPDNPKQSSTRTGSQVSDHEEQRGFESIGVDPEIAICQPISGVDKSSLLLPLPLLKSVLPLETTPGVNIAVQLESPSKQDQCSKEEVIRPNNNSESWVSYQPISQLDRPSLGADQNPTNNLEPEFLESNGHRIGEESMENLDSTINLTHLGMNSHVINQSGNHHRDRVKLNEKQTSNSNSKGKPFAKATSSTLESPKNSGRLFHSSDQSQDRHSCPPNGQTIFKSSRSSIQFSSPLCLPQYGTFVTTTSNENNLNSTIGTIADTNTVLGDITQSFVHP